MNRTARREGARRRFAHAAAVLFALTVSAACFGQGGASATFGWTVGGEPRSVTIPETVRDGVSYVSLTELSKALGAGFKAEGGRVQIDLVGQTAWAPIDGAEVYGSLNRMTLTFPLKMADGQALLAKNDVAPLFRTCFRIALTTSTGGGLQSSELAMPELDAELARLTPDDVPGFAQPAAGPAFRRVVIDPGHGGADTGAVGPGGAVEKDIALAVAKLLKTELEKTPGVSVWLTRSEDAELGAAARGNVGAERAADVFVSLHVGASLSPDAAGFEIFYPIAARTTQGEAGASSPARSRKSEALAQRLEAALTEGTGRPSRGIRSLPLRSLPATESAVVLVELGCVTSPEDENVLRTAEYHQRAAAALAAGLQAPEKAAP